MATEVGACDPSVEQNLLDGDDLNLGPLDLTSEDFLLDEVDVYIQANLEDAIVKEALKTGVDLRQYSKQVEGELLEVENASIQDYIKESQNIASLHKQIASCDTILECMEGMLNVFQSDLSSISSDIMILQRQSLSMNTKMKTLQSVYGELNHFVKGMAVTKAMIRYMLSLIGLQRMEEMLNGFQADLSSISSEIKTLQEQSICMNIKLQNRQAVRGELSQFVDEMVVSEAMIGHIQDTPVTEREFLEQLQELNHKINFVKEQSFNDAKSCYDVRDILEKLKIKAIAKIREFLLQKIYQFRKPTTNYQIPQDAMLKYRFYNEFLMANERHVAKEVRDEYVETMSKIYYSYFKSYYSKIMKLQYEELADKDDLMGVEDTAKRGIFSSKPSLKNRSTIFTLGNRGSILTTELEAPIIVPHAAQKSELKYSFESLFRSLHYALVDNCCREYLFISDFFMVSDTSAQDLFNTILGKTLSMFQKQVESYVDSCYDSIALFLCIHLIKRYQAIMSKRNVTALDKYWQTLLDLLWPRFEMILKLNIQSIRDCDPQRLGQIDVRPHYITRRYAEFSAAIVGINQTSPSELVDRVLGRLQGEVENFILRMAAEFPQRKEQLVFLINNYDMMLNVLMERMPDESPTSESFKELLNARTAEYIEEVLSPYFGGMITFVKDVETQVERGNTQGLRNLEGRVAQLVRAFNNDWKKAIDSINQDVMRSFTNFRNGTQILQGVLTQLIQCYHRFTQVLQRQPFSNMPVRNELINIHNVMVEVRKHKQLSDLMSIQKKH